MQEKKNVVITGMGAMTPFGSGVKRLWQSSINGDSAIRNVRRFPVPSGIPDIAASLPEELYEQLNDDEKDALFKWAMEEVYLEVLQSAGLTEETMKKKVGGAVFFSNHFDIDAYRHAEKNNLTISNEQLDQWHLAKWTNWLQDRSGANKGSGIITGCTGSHTAIATGMGWIAEGICDWAIVGGGDFLHPELMIELDSLKILSSTGCRPFSGDSDGTVIGDGLGLLLLESEETALKRSAPIHARLKGSAITMDTTGIGQFSNDGSVLKHTMEQALLDARSTTEEIGYIQAAATGASKVDHVEINAIHSHFKKILPPVSSVKSQIGHSIGGTGVLGLIVTALALKKKQLPPTIGQFERTKIGLDTVPVSREHSFSTALVNGVSMSGHHCTIVIGEGDR